jgi:predicted nucleic acid-binding Zn ribbon protein
MTDEPLTKCPECGNHIRRVLFPAGVVFKGSGFYSTDYSHQSSTAPGNSNDSAKTESSTDKSSSETATSGTASKPAENSTTTASPAS